jgi:hypothetical protein
MANEQPMTTAAEVVDLIVQRFGDILSRPLMYGGTAAGVDNLLWQLVLLWSEALGRRERFYSVVMASAEDAGRGSESVSSYFKRNHPEASEGEIAEHVVSSWKQLAEQILKPI